MAVGRITLALLLSVAATAVPAAAQKGQPPEGLAIVPDHSPRHGFWGTFGLGVGSETFSAPSVTADPGWLARPTIDMRVGGTPNQHLRLGAELISWFNSEGSVSQSLGGTLAVAQIYPSPSQGFFLKGGGGYAWNSFSDNYYYYGYYLSYDSGFLWSAGAGWEIPVSRTLNIMPTVDYYGFDFGGRSTENYNEELWNFGISIQLP